jgi:hypothetical protein
MHTQTQGNTVPPKGYRYFFWLWTIGQIKIYVTNDQRDKYMTMVRPTVSTKALIPDDEY